MLSDPDVESFVLNQNNADEHFIQKIKRKDVAYAIQIISLSVSLILSLVVATSQQTIAESIRFLVVATVIMTFHACFIILIENCCDVHCKRTPECHSIKYFTITYKQCTYFASAIQKTINMLNTLGSVSSLGYLIALKMYVNDDLFISTYALLMFYLISNFPKPINRQSYIHRSIQVAILLIFVYVLIRTLKRSTHRLLLICILVIQSASSRFSFEQLNKRSLRLIRDGYILQLLSKQFIAKTFANLLPHRALDYILQDREIRLQVHANMYLLVINIDIPCLRAKLQKHMHAGNSANKTITSSTTKIPPLTDCYINHIIASIVNQFISCVDTILLDDFPQLTKVYSNLDTIKVIAGESFAQYNNKHESKPVDVDTGNIESRDYMKTLSTFALLVSKCAGVFALRVDSVITFGDIAIGFMGSHHISCYEIFGAPVALATRLHEKIVIYNHETAQQSDSSHSSYSQSTRSSCCWNRSTTNTDSNSFLSYQNTSPIDESRDKNHEHASKSHSTKCSLSLSKDSPSHSTPDHVHLHSEIDLSPLNNEPVSIITTATTKSGSTIKENLVPVSSMTFSQANHSTTDNSVEFVELPSNVYFSVVNMLSRPIEEYGNRGTEGSDTITSDVIFSDMLSDDPQPLTNTDLESSMNFRRFLAARKGGSRAALYSKRRSVIKALNTATSPTDDKFPQKLILLNQHSESNVSTHHRHKMRQCSPTTHQSTAFNSTYFYSSSSTNSMRLWSPKNLKIDALYVNNALNQISYPSSSKTSSPNFQEVCDIRLSINQISLDGLSTYPLLIEYPSRITHKHKNFLFYKPPLYMFYDNIKLTLSGSSLSSNSSAPSTCHYSLGILSFTNHNYSLIVSLLAFGIKYRILVSEQHVINNERTSNCSATDVKECIQLSSSTSIEPSVGETVASSHTTYDTLSHSECVDRRFSSTSAQKDERSQRSQKSQKTECWDADSGYQLLLNVEESILRTENPNSSAYQAIHILDSIPIYKSKAMRRIFRYLNTDLERFDRVITRINKSLLPQSNMSGSILTNTNLDFNYLVANAGLVHTRKQPDTEWSSLLREVKMAVVKPEDNTMDFHSCREYDNSQVSSSIYHVSGDPTLMATSSDSQSASVATPVLESTVPEQQLLVPAPSNVLSTQALSDSRPTGLYIQTSQLLPDVMAPENLPIPGQQNLTKQKHNDPNLTTLMTIVTRKTESFDSSSVNTDGMLPVHHFKRRSRSFVDFSANKIDLLYSTIGRKSASRLAEVNSSLLEQDRESKKLTEHTRVSQINEFKSFIQNLGIRFRQKNVNQSNSDSLSDHNCTHSASFKISIRDNADDEVEIPLLMLKPSSIDISYTNDSGTESFPETPKSIAAHLPAHRSALSQLCHSISPSSDSDAKSDGSRAQKKDLYSLSHSFANANKTHTTTLQDSDESMHALSLVQESEQSDSISNLSNIQFNKSPASVVNSITDKTSGPISDTSAHMLPLGPSAHLKTAVPNTPNLSGPTDCVSNLTNITDSYSCLYKLGINSENEETDNSVQSVLLCSTSITLPDDGTTNVPMNILTQLQGGKSTMGGNPRVVSRQLAEDTNVPTSSLSITSCTDSPHSNSMRESLSHKDKRASGKQSSGSGTNYDPIYNPIAWPTDSFITLGKPATKQLNTNSSNTVNVTGRSIETSFHATTSHAFKDIVTTRAAPTPAYTPINLLNVNQYKSIVYATFGIAFDLIARPSICISNVSSVHPVFSSSSLQGTHSNDNRHTNDDAIVKSKADYTLEENQSSTNAKTINCEPAQETLFQTRERHNKFLHSKWRSMIYLKRCSLNAALSYIQLSDTTEDEEMYETSESRSPTETERPVTYRQGIRVDGEHQETSITNNFFSCARLKRISNEESECHNWSLDKPGGWIYNSISTNKKALLQFLLRPMACKSIVEEHVSLFTTFTSGYLLRSFFDMLFYIIFIFILFGAHNTSETDQSTYLLYIYGRFLTFMQPCQKKQAEIGSVDNPRKFASFLMPSTIQCNFSLLNLVRVTKIDSTSTGLPSLLLQNYIQLWYFHVFLGSLLLIRILLTVFRVFSASRKSRMVVSTRAVLFAKLMKESPILYRLVQATRSTINIVDIVSGSVLIIARTLILYEYFRDIKSFNLGNMVFFFFLIIVTWNCLAIEISPLCNTSIGACVSLYTHICANIVFFWDSKNYLILITRILKELKYIRLIISYFIFDSLRKATNSPLSSNSTDTDIYSSTKYIQESDHSGLHTLCPMLSNYISILHRVKSNGKLKTIWTVYRTIRNEFPHCTSNLIMHLSCALSKASAKYLDSTTCQSLGNDLFIAHELPSVRTIQSGIYFLCVILCIARVMFGQLDLYQAMLRHVTQSIFIYSETKKLIGAIAYNKLERIFFDFYLHTISSFCNILTYQAEYLHKSINMGRDILYLGKQLKLVGMASDLIYDSEIQLPCIKTECTNCGRMKRKNSLPVMPFYNLHSKLSSILRSKDISHSSTLLTTKKKKKKVYNDTLDVHPYLTSNHTMNSNRLLNKTIIPTSSFTNLHECYDIFKSLESLATDRSYSGNMQPEVLYSDDEIYQIIRSSKFTAWRKYAIFRSCYNSCNFTFRYLYDINILKLVLAKKFSMKICDESMYSVKPNIVFEPYYSKILAGILQALLVYKDRRFNSMPSPFIFVPSSYMLCITITELYDAIVDEGAHITLLKYMSLLKIINDTVAYDPNLLYIQKDVTFYIIYNSAYLSKFSSIHTISNPMDCYIAIFYLCKIAYTIKKLFLWELEKRFYTQTFKVFSYINLHHEFNICLVGRRLNRLDILDTTALHERIKSISNICGQFDIVIQDELYKITKEVQRLGNGARGVLHIELDETGIYKKLLNISEGI